MKKIFSYSFLHIIVLIVLLTGAAGSLYFMFNAGHNQKSILLIVLFTGWVLSPFVALIIADMISMRWLINNRATLYFLVIFITVLSLISYSGALNLPGTKPAFKFLIIPLLSWLFIVIVVSILYSLSKRSINEKNRVG
jgi:hypothetical protein